MAPPQGACGRGCAPVPNSSWGRGLFERSEFRSPNLSGPGQRHPKGRARAPMVLGPFERRTKGSRRAGPKPRKHLSLSVILDISNRGSRVVVFCIPTRAIPWKPPQGACEGAAAPRSRTQLGGEDCLSEASSAALTFGTGAKEPEGPRTGLPMVLGPFAETKGPRRAGAKPRKPLPPRRAGTNPRKHLSPFLSSLRTKEKEKALDPRSGSGMTDKRRKTARDSFADVGQKARTEVRRPAGRPVVTTA